MKEVVVISLGGSLIIPEEPNAGFLIKFVKTLRKNYEKNKFVIVCGGGPLARKYIEALKLEGKSKKELSIVGIKATRTNASFVMQLFGKEANGVLPKNMKEIKDNLVKNNLVICGALRFTPNSTSDTTAAKLANYLKTYFINMTNVKGLYTDNPKTNKKAKFISKITLKEFEKKALKIKHKPGQHFVLDQKAATIIRKNKIRTYIIGKDPENLNKLLNKKSFIGTTIKK